MKRREIRFELLRIICMLMVTSLHFFSYSGVLSRVFEPCYYVGWFGETFSLVATNVFVIISSYFIIDRLSPNFFSLFRLYKKVWIISVLGLLVSLFFQKQLGLSSAVDCLFPVSSRLWGFFNNYFFYLLLSPLVCLACKKMSKKQHLIICIIVIILTSIIPLFFFDKDYLGINSGNSFVWFLCILFVIGFFKKYKIEPSRLLSCILYIAPCLIQFASRIIIAFVTKHLFDEVRYSGVLYGGDSNIFTFISSLGLFFFVNSFKRTHEHDSSKEEKLNLGIVFVSFAANSSFLVYLIQEHPLLRETIWELLINRTDAFTNSLILKFIISLFALYIVAMIANLIIELLIKLTTIKKVDEKIKSFRLDFQEDKSNDSL